MRKQHKLALLLLSTMVLGWSSAHSWGCDGNHQATQKEAQPDTEVAQNSETIEKKHPPSVQLETAIKSPDGVLEPGTYYVHPLLTEQGFTELTLSKDDQIVTRFALSPAQSEPTPITAATGFPVIHTEAALTEDRKSVIFTVFEGPDRYISVPFSVVTDKAPLITE